MLDPDIARMMLRMFVLSIFGGLAPDIARMGFRMLFVKHFGGRGPNIARMTIPTARPPETVERRRRDRRAGRARATGTLQQTLGSDMPRMAKANKGRR